MTREVDLFVIGAGSGGVRAARIAAGHGASVMIAEEFRFGGTCVIRGCVPKKLLVLASRFADAFDEARSFGWHLDAPRFDWATLREAKEREISRLEGIYRRNLENAKVEAVASRATLAGPDTVRIETTGEIIRAGRILIATGGTPFRPEIPGAELAVTSNEIFDLPALPASIVIEGGGFIAVEFGCLLARLGVKVCVVYRGGQIMRGFDDDLREHLASAMRAHGIEILTQTELKAIERKEDGYRVALSSGESRDTGLVMLATGRLPKTDGLGLEAAGVATGAKGAITVTPDSRTNVPTIWAVGDVTNRLALTPIAIREGHAFADTEFGGKPWTCDHHDVPAAVFSTPEIGTVGLTETHARERHGAIAIYRSTFRPMHNVLSDAPERMLMKLVVDVATDRVMGVHICGPDAAEMVQVAGIAIKMGATKAQFDATVALHPSAAEELVTMRTPVT
ncbi:MAG: glutathione-disulfide reductase [Burkholderiaceae bacterium]